MKSAKYARCTTVPAQLVQVPKAPVIGPVGRASRKGAMVKHSGLAQSPLSSELLLSGRQAKQIQAVLQRLTDPTRSVSGEISGSRCDGGNCRRSVHLSHRCA